MVTVTIVTRVVLIQPMWKTLNKIFVSDTVSNSVTWYFFVCLYKKHGQGGVTTKVTS